MRVCLAYDCLYPWTVGGAERWLRALAENLANAGNEVTYLTRKQWDDDAFPEIPGVQVIAVSPRSGLYNDEGTRRIDEALRFGWGVFRYLSRHRNDFDVIHVTAAPFFGVFGAQLASAGTGVPVFVDWDETWTRDYWHKYLGKARGEVGWQVQQLCSRLARLSFVKSDLHAKRLRRQGYKGELTVLPGLYDGPLQRNPSNPRRPPLVLFAGRHIPEKRVLAIPAAIVEARKQVPELEALILGDGPDREELLREIERSEAGEFISAPGFVDTDQVGRAMDEASCLLLPSSREGYGIVVVEAASRGTPVVLVAGADNSAVELIDEGRNGTVASDPCPQTLGEAIAKAVMAGEQLRGETSAWFAENAAAISAARSASVVCDHHLAAIRSTRVREPSAYDGADMKTQFQRLATRARLTLDRALTGSLKILGVRDSVLKRVLERRRTKRLRAEASGSDALSRPALYGMDSLLDEIIDMDGGFFVEAGANDGYTQSNTYWLARFRGWRGLLVEPMQELYEQCVVERPESEVRRAALVPLDYEGDTVRMRFGDLMSSVVGSSLDEDRTAAGVVQGWRDAYEAEVPATSLTALLDEISAPEIDLLSLDVEGFEPQVLRGLELDRWAPRWILVEVHDFESGRPPIEAILGDRYVLDRALSPVDLLYRRVDVPEPSTRS